MVHLRETRASASEIKFLIQPELAPYIQAWARTHLEADPHGSGEFGDEYEISSLYFDTRDYDVFYRRHSFGRAKYRVRRYGPSDVVFLERKLRKPGLLIKRRTVAPLAKLDHLQAAAAEGWSGDWFHRRLLIRRLQAVCQVSYLRSARILETADGPARLTLDRELRAAPTRAPRFTADGAVPVLADRVILELKYRVQLPAIFRRLVEEFRLQPESASKYRLGMAALGYRPPVAERSMILTHSDASYA